MIGESSYTIAKRGQFGAVASLLAITLLVSLGAQAQGDPSNCIPGDPTNTVECSPGDPRSNVNVVGMTPDPADFPDTSYRQQNEPACAIRPGDSACIICAYNDYRGVEAFGDAWEGVSQSCDAGDTWKSRLAPGHPSYEPVDYRIPAEFAADPRLAAIPGMAIFNFIAGYRDTNVGVLAIQHWLEVNKEDADFYEPAVETYIADEGTEGRFLDKPDMVAVLDGGTITLDTVMENSDLCETVDGGACTPGHITRKYPSGKLYVAYAAFTGSNSVKVLVKTSDDWGRTFKNQAMKLSEDQNQVSGITLTAVGNKVLAVWRRKGDGNDVDSIMYSVISNGGKKATKGEVLADVCAFDQPTLVGDETDLDVVKNVVTFRTNDFPWTANDGKNAFVFYSDRGRDPVTNECLADGKPRIVMHHSDLSGQVTWTPQRPIDQTATDATFQFMPTAFGANGKVQVAWYDTRRETTNHPLDLAFVADYDFLYPGYTGTLVNRTVDVFTTNVTIVDQGEAIIPPPVRASQFSIVVDKEDANRTEYETEASFANKKLFAQGKAPFLGDYIAIAAREYRRNSTDTAWESNASKVEGANEDFFVAWTDNRDVRGTIGGVKDTLPYTTSAAQGTTTSTLETGSGDEVEQLVADVLEDVGPPRDTTQTAEGIDGSEDDFSYLGQCSPGQGDFSRTRDANIYGSLIKDRARIYAPNPSKPLGGLQRAFPVVLSNSDDVDKTYTLEIVPGACTGSCKASFRQELPGDPTTTLFEPPPNSEVPYITVPAKSSIARTVFVSGVQPPVIVRALDYPSGNLVATIKLANALGAEFRDPENCAAAQAADPTVVCSVAENELHNLELQTVDAYLLAVLTGQVDDLAAEAVLGTGPEATSLINWAVAGVVGDGSGDVDGDGKTDGACCEGEDPATYGSVIEYANKFLAFETIDIQTGQPVDPDANLLNANLLNANLLNANLLNANLLNANLLNANLLNADLLNASLLNANLLNTNPEGYVAPAATELDVFFGENSTLVSVAESGGCCGAPPLLTTYGDVIMWHINNPEFINELEANANLLNAALLNANLLNLNLLNANLLNANLLNANLLNANLLNANLLNANLLNANLLNPTIEAANLLNANLLNADLLNASLLNPTLVAQAVDAGCCGVVDYEDAAAADVIIYAVGHPEIINASLLNASLLNANLLNANLLNANLLNANLLNANLLNANLLNANLLNANLLNANLLNANLLNADLLNANLLNANLLNSSLTDVPTDPTTGEPTGESISVNVPDCNEETGICGRVDSISVPVTFDDYTYPITNNGNVTTAIDADITINAPTVTTDDGEALDVIGTKLIIWTTNATPTVVDCVERVQLNTRVQSITSPDANFEVADINNPFRGQASAVVAPGETVFVTLRVVGTTEQLKNVRVSGFTASSQAANCSLATGCDDALNDGIEQITFADQDPPVITVPDNIVVEANNTGGAVVDYTVTVFDASDANPSLDCLPESGTVFPVGSTPVTCNATDASGNQADSAGFNVVVLDTVAPTLSLPDNITAEATSSSGAVVTFAATASDNVSTPTVSCDATSGATFSLGTTTVNCTASETTGSATATGSFDITVQDTTPPTLSLPDNITAEATSSSGAVVTFAATASDNVSTPTVSCDATSGATFGLDTTTVNCTAIETTGSATATGSFDITVQDTTPPTLSLPDNITAEATSSSGAVVTFAATASDNVSTPTVSCNPPSGTTFGLGTTTVTCAATETTGSASSTGSFDITVQDTTLPTITAPGPVIQEANGDPNSSVDIGTATAADLFGVLITNNAPADGFPLGNTTVVWTATDNNGLFATATQVVKVVDTTAPRITLIAPNPQVIEAGYAYVELGATATDPVFGDVTGAIVIDSSAVDASTVGNYTVTYDVDDASGNAAAQVTRTVTVEDTTPPVIDPPTIPDDLTPNGPDPFELTADANTIEVSWPIGVDDADPNVVISCSIDGQALTEESRVEADGTVTVTYKYDFPVGSTTVTCTATDADNPPTEIVFTIDVIDVTPPLAPVTPTDDFSSVQATSSAGATVTWSKVFAQDAVDGSVEAICAPESGSTFSLGTTTVSCTATDLAGLTSEASTFDVTIVDTTPPTLNGVRTDPWVVIAGADGTASPVIETGISATDIADPAPTIACGPQPPLDFGPNTITCVATDASGNKASSSYIIDVVDNTNPTITLLGLSSITLEAGVENYTELGATAVDNVDGDISANIVITGSVDTGKVGTYIVSYNVTDNQGNKAATVDRTILVEDTIAPVITVPTSPLIITTATSPANVTYDVSVVDAGHPATAATCVPASGDAFIWGDTLVTCNATDGSNAADSATFTVRVRYLYDIEVTVGKTRVKLGSTIPFDWLYRDWDGNLVDSSNLQPDIGITWSTTSDCINPDATGPSGEDSGSSDFRYSAADGIWQYSLQTKDLIGGGQQYLVSIVPPGLGVEAATTCVTLR